MSEVLQFEEFAKIPRLRRECTVTEKIDGSNAQILVVDDARTVIDSVRPATDFCVKIVETDKYIRGLYAGSRNRWLKPGKLTDNFGFAQWVFDHAHELAQLGPGRHYGEWWGQGIQRTYGLDHKNFSLFNAARWCSRADYDSNKGYLRDLFPKIMPCPSCCSVVPVMHYGPFDTHWIDAALTELERDGSKASPGFKPAEGIIVYHSAGNVLFKQTIEKDAEPKSLQKEAA